MKNLLQAIAFILFIPAIISMVPFLIFVCLIKIIAPKNSGYLDNIMVFERGSK